MNNNLDLQNSNLLGEEFSNAHGDKFKKFRDKEKERRNKVKGKLKKIATKLKDKVGKAGKKFRNRFRAIVRKGILFNMKHNIHGTATRLSPAVLPVMPKAFKPSFKPKAQKVYTALVGKWKELGGEEADLKSAIEEGSKKRFFKTPYKSAQGNNSDDFYGVMEDYYNLTNESLLGADGYSDLTNESLLEAEGGYSNLTNQSLFDTMGADGDYSNLTNESLLGADADTETPPKEDTEPPAIEEVPEPEEKKKGIKGFFAMLKGLFHKHGADENPMEAGTPDAKAYDEDKKADAGNEPDSTEADNHVVKELTDSAKTDDAGGATDESKGAEKTITDDEEKVDDGKIFGMPKMAVYIGGGLLALAIGYLVVKKMGKGKG